MGYTNLIPELLPYKHSAFPTGFICLNYKLRHVYIVERIDCFAVISDFKVKMRTR